MSQTQTMYNTLLFNAYCLMPNTFHNTLYIMYNVIIMETDAEYTKLP